MIMKQTVSLAVLICVSIFATGCTTPAYNYQVARLSVSEPPLNTPVSVSVGDIMVKQGSYSEQDGIKLDQPVRIGMGSYSLTSGTYKKVGGTAQGTFYEPADGAGAGAIQKGLLADPYKNVFVKANENKICVVTIFNVRACADNANIKYVKIPSYQENSFQQTLLYLGKYGDKINIGYREFSSDMARPAFNNDVEYDLRESTTIAYKGAKLEILEASNQNVRFRLITNFNTANLAGR